MMSKFPPPTLIPQTQTKPEEKPDEAKIQQEALTVVEKAALIKIDSQASYDFAADLLTKQIKPMRKKWKEYWDDIKKPMREALNKVQDKFNESDEKLAKAENQVKAEILRWDDEQRRKLEAEQRAAQEAAEALEREKREQEAAEMEAQGVSEEEIEEFNAAPVVAIAAPVQATYERASGISTRENWKAKVTSVKDLCKTIGAGKLKFAPSDEAKVAQFFESMLAARARADKSTLNISGVVAYNDPIVSGRSR